MFKEYYMLKKDEYFTAGQLASLYGIPKQTLLYYDKSELLIPEFIHDNGYRYYSVSQYLTLEIILNMRKLNIPINDIKEYLHNRSTEKFQQLLLNKKKECDHIISEMEQIKKSLDLSMNSLTEITHCPLEQIQLSFHPAKPLLVSESLINTKSVRERVKILAHHNQETFDKNHFKEFSTGWIIQKDDFLYKANADYRKYLDSKGYKYEYFESTGGHIWRNWRIYLTTFAQKIFK